MKEWTCARASSIDSRLRVDPPPFRRPTEHPKSFTSRTAPNFKHHGVRFLERFDRHLEISRRHGIAVDDGGEARAVHLAEGQGTQGNAFRHRSLKRREIVLGDLAGREPNHLVHDGLRQAGNIGPPGSSCGTRCRRNRPEPCGTPPRAIAVLQVILLESRTKIRSSQAQRGCCEDNLARAASGRLTRRAGTWET